jgi:hypothetical protein
MLCTRGERQVQPVIVLILRTTMTRHTQARSKLDRPHINVIATLTRRSLDAHHLRSSTFSVALMQLPCWGVLVLASPSPVSGESGQDKDKRGLPLSTPTSRRTSLVRLFLGALSYLRPQINVGIC